MSAKTVLIGGYWGFGNVGDEAVVATVVDDVRGTWPDCRIILTSERPALTQAMHGVEAVGWRRLAALIEAIRSSDHVVVGGGGLWNSYFPYETSDLLRDTDNYSEHILSLPVLARLLQRPVTIYGVGGGVILGAAPQALASMAIACTGVAVVRDQVTHRFFESLGAAPSTVAVAADPAFRLGEADAAECEPVRDLLAWAELHRPIVVVPRNWLSIGGAKLADKFGQLLTAAQAATARPILFLPFDLKLTDDDVLSDDAGIIRTIAALLPDEVEHRSLVGEHHPRVISRLLACGSAVVSMRLHGCILAVRSAVPVLGVAYDPKVAAILTDIGLAASLVEIDELAAPATIAKLVARIVDPHQRAIVDVARHTAINSSRAAPRHLGEALTRPLLPPLPIAAADLQSRLASDMLRVRAAIDQHSLPVMQVLRDCVNTGHFQAGQALAAIFRVIDPASGEWVYLDALSRDALGAASQEVLDLFALAETRGFDPGWVCYVRACHLIARGQITAAEVAVEWMRANARSHPARAGLEALLASSRKAPDAEA